MVAKKDTAENTGPAVQPTVVNDVPAKPERKKKYTVAAGVSEEMYARIEDFRWANRMSVAEVVTAAVEQFMNDTEK